MKQRSKKEEPKYEFTGETRRIGKRLLHRIRALRTFTVPKHGHYIPRIVERGDIGGWVESVDNLSQSGNCWVFDDALVFESAHVSGDAGVLENANVAGSAKVSGHAYVYGNAWVRDYARVNGNSSVFEHAKVTEHASISGNAFVYDKADICGYAHVGGDAYVYGCARLSDNDTVNSLGDYILFMDNRSGGWLTYCATTGRWHIGTLKLFGGRSFTGTGKELLRKIKEDSPLSMNMYRMYVRFAEKLYSGRNHMEGEK